MKRALDLIDRSLRLNTYGAHRALADHDRTWLAPHVSELFVTKLDHHELAALKSALDKVGLA
jgi:hypothetical protein